MQDIADKMFSIEHLKRNISFGDSPFTIDFRYFRADLKKKEVIEEFFNTVNNFLKDAPEEFHNYTVGMLLIYMTYRYPPTAPHKRTNLTYKRDIRKYNSKSVRNMFNPAFLELKSKLNLKYDEIEGKLMSEINKMGSRTFSRELWKESLYFQYPFNHDLSEEEYDDYKQVLIENYFKWQESQKESEKKKDEFWKLFQDERPEFHALLYEAEIIFNLFWEMFFIKMLEQLEIKYGLTEIERKVYLLSYTRQELFNYSIPVFEEILSSFLNYLDKKDLIALIFTIAYDDRRFDGYILNKFTEFVKYYPVWLDMMQMDESLSDEEISLILNKTNRFFFESHKDVKKYYNVKDPDNADQTKKIYIKEVLLDTAVEGTNDLLFHDLISIESAIDIFYEKDLERALFLKFDLEALKIFVEELPDKQKEAIKAVYLEERTQEEFARSLGVKQAAISQRISTALKNMRKRFDE